jgi:hypothetical protein
MLLNVAVSLSITAFVNVRSIGTLVLFWKSQNAPRVIPVMGVGNTMLDINGFVME